MSKRRYFKSDHPVTRGKDMTLDDALNALIALFSSGEIGESITFRLGGERKTTSTRQNPSRRAYRRLIMNPLNKANNNPEFVSKLPDDISADDAAMSKLIAHMALDEVLQQEQDYIMALLEETMAEEIDASAFGDGWRSGLGRLKALILARSLAGSQD